MKPIRFAVFSLCAAAAFSTPKVQAETVAPQAQDAAPIESVTIDLHYVKPSVMAYWLDLQRAEVGRVGVDSRETPFLPFDPRHPKVEPAGKYLQAVPARSTPKIPLQVDPSLVVLPAGIEKIEASDQTNQISICGSREGVQKLRELIAVLDKPIPMLEVEMQLVQLPKTWVPTGAMKMPSSNPNVEAFDGEAIVKLIADGKAKLVSSPRLTTFNKMQARMVSMESNTHFAPPLDSAGKSNRSITIGFGQKFSLTPTLNRDGTFVLNLDCVDGFFQSNSATSREFTPLPNPLNRTIQTVVNVSSGETVALRNVKEQDGDSWVLLVKANLSPFNAN